MTARNREERSDSDKIRVVSSDTAQRICDSTVKPIMNLQGVIIITILGSIGGFTWQCISSAAEVRENRVSIRANAAQIDDSRKLMAEFFQQIDRRFDRIERLLMDAKR